MPDDQVVNGIAEQETPLPADVDEALNSFMEDDDAGGDDDTHDISLEPDEETDEETDEKPVSEKDAKKPAKDGQKPEESSKKEGEDDEHEEYPDALAERLKTSGKQEPVETPSDPQPPAAPAAEPEKKAPAPKPMEDFSNLISIDDLPDDEIKVGDVSVNLKEYKNDYPEDFAAIMAVGSMLAKTIVEKQLQSGEFVKADKISDLHDEIQDIRFWDQISEKHSDARKINKDPDFLNWLDNQDEPLKRLARGMESPEDGILILDFYKKSKAKKKASDFDSKGREKKKKTDDLHKGTMRNKATVNVSDDVDINDAEAAFNEDEEDDDL